MLRDCFYCLPKLTIYPRKIGWRKMSIEAGRIREHPDRRRSNGLRLLSEVSAGLVECQSVGADAETREYPWPIIVYLGAQLLPTGSEFFSGQLGRRYRSPFKDIRNAIAVGQ